MEDIELEEELSIRKRIGEIYTKDEADFQTEAAYNDYLEMREDVIHALLLGESIDEIERQIEVYKQQNQESIHRYKRRRLEQTNAAFTVTLEAKTIETAPTESNEAPLRNPQPLPLEKGYEVTFDGTLKPNRLPENRSEWDAMARATGWNRNLYATFVRRHSITNIHQ